MRACLDSEEHIALPAIVDHGRLVAEHEKKLRLLADAAFDGIVGHDYEHVVEVNHALCAMYGYAAAEMIGMPVLALVHPDWHDDVRERFRSPRVRYESMAVRKDGTTFPIEVSAAEVPSDDGVFRVAAIRDITVRRQYETALAHSEQKFRALSQVAFDGVLTERDGRVEEANDAFAEMFGYAPGDLPGRPVASLITPHGTSRERRDGTGTRADGSTFPVSLFVATPVDGQRIYAVRDVTREKRAQEQLSESERRYRELSESTHDLLCLHDLEGGVLEANSAALRTLGYSHEEIEGANLRTILTPSAAAGLDEYLRTILAEGTAEGHMAVLTKGGERRIWHYRNVLQTSGNRAYVRGLARDVTDQARAAAALQKSEQHFRSIIENISDTITILDGEGRVQYHSPSVERVLGYPPATGQAHYSDWIHPDDLPAAREFFSAQIANPGAKGTLDARVKHRDGSWRWLSMVTTARQSPAGPSLIVNGRDVTERRLLLAQLEQATRVNSLGHLAATVAHEFNNVLMGMQPFAELLQRRGVSPDTVAKAASYIVSSVGRGKRVALNILRFTQPASPSFAAVNLAEWCERLLPELEPSLGNSIALETSIPRGLAVTADATQLAQVLSNLVSNARDAMSRGGRLSIVARRPRPDETFPFGVVEHAENFVQISVSDTGEGMSEDVIAHIFEPLFTTKQNGGTGLGLAVVHQVMARHGGAVFVVSRPGEGTTFHLFIPSATSAPSIEDPVEAPGRLGAMKILIVDDEPGILDGLADCLAGDGAVTRTGSTGAEALAAAETFAADVAVIDIRLPDCDGIELGRRLRERQPDLRIVYASGHADSRRVPASDPNVTFLQKPFAVCTLIEEIARRGWGATS